MKYIDRRLKGTYGYIKKQLIFEIIKTLILFAMALGIFFIGYLTLHTKKSLWSIFAVLALLPACKSLVGVIMLARFPSLGPVEYDEYSSAVGSIPVLYENILTTKDRTFYIPVICYAANTLIAFAGNKYETKKIKEHLDDVLKKGGHKATVKIYDNREAFFERIKQLREKYGNEDINAYGVFETVKAVSL